MMRRMSLKTVAPELQGQLINGDYHFDSVSTDTRNIKAGDLFVALRGPRFDAHDYLAEAQAKQAGAFVVERKIQSTTLPSLVVADTTKALGDIARVNRQEFHGPLVAITGSSGKTSVKTMVGNILAQMGEVLVTRGNLNNHIGVPLTLFDLNPHHQTAVIEMGASGLGEIAYLSAIALPTVAVVTNALRAHIAGFGSLEGVAKTKGEIYAQLGAEGTAVINLDDQFAPAWMAVAGEAKRLTFSVHDQSADFSARDIQEHTLGLRFVMAVPDRTSIGISLRLLGRQNIANALAAAACAYAAGATIREIKAGLELTRPVPGRMESKAGLHGSVVIDDSYNANPDSVRAAIEALAQMQGERVLVLGDLAELGEDSLTMHKELGAYAKSLGLDRLVCVGEHCKAAFEAFGTGAKTFETRADAASHVRSLLHREMKVLVKGSRSSRMEEIVGALIQSQSASSPAEKGSQEQETGGDH